MASRRCELDGGRPTRVRVQTVSMVLPRRQHRKRWHWCRHFAPTGEILR